MHHGIYIMCLELKTSSNRNILRANTRNLRTYVSSPSQCKYAYLCHEIIWSRAQRITIFDSWRAPPLGYTISGQNGYASKLALVRLCGTIVNTDFVRQRLCTRPSHFRTVNRVKARSRHRHTARLSLTESFRFSLYTRWSGGRRKFKRTHNTEVEKDLRMDYSNNTRRALRTARVAWIDEVYRHLYLDVQIHISVMSIELN